MVMASQSQGVKQLLAAESKAAEKVSEARKRKAKRLKEAKEDATKEIEKYRQERDKQYKEHEYKIMGSKGDSESQIEEATKVKLKEINETVAAHKEEALTNLLRLVCTIKPELHQNFRP